MKVSPLTLGHRRGSVEGRYQLCIFSVHGLLVLWFNCLLFELFMAASLERLLLATAGQLSVPCKYSATLQSTAEVSMKRMGEGDDAK